jgi:hypothetical protein
MTVIKRSVEIWLSTVTVKSIGRNSFLPLGDLEDKMVEFIEHHDEYLTRSHTWTLITNAPVVYRKVG